jgi:hypothetical protein
MLLLRPRIGEEDSHELVVHGVLWSKKLVAQHERLRNVPVVDASGNLLLVEAVVDRVLVEGVVLQHQDDNMLDWIGGHRFPLLNARGIF